MLLREENWGFYPLAWEMGEHSGEPCAGPRAGCWGAGNESDTVPALEDCLA